MAIKLNNLSKWQVLPDGKSLLLRSEVLRRIKLHLNTEGPVHFTALENGAATFLAVVDGVETIEFTAHGNVEVAAVSEAGYGVWYWTDDGDDHSHSLGDHRLFVKPMTREHRSPEMEALAAKLQAKADRRFAMQEANNERLRAQLAEERAAYEAAIAAAESENDVGHGAGGEEQQPPGEGASPGAAEAGAGAGSAGT